MNKLIAILGGIGFGALLMYLFDPQGGNRRRALIRDKAVSFSNKAQETINETAQDLSNRAKGMMHEAGIINAEKSEMNENQPFGENQSDNQFFGENQQAKGQTA